MRKIVCWTCVVIIVLVAIVLSIGFEEMAATVSIFIIAAVPCLFLMAAANHRRPTDGIRYDKDEKTLYLRERLKANRDYMKLVNVPAEYRTDHPAELVYTGATVGGVHTGGFHVEEAYTSSRNIGSDRYVIWFTSGEDAFIVKQVVLFDDALIREAKAHPQLRQFLQGDTLVLKYKDSQCQMDALERGAVDSAMRRGDTTAAKNVAMRAIMASYMKRNDAKAVLNWMCGK